MKKFLVLLPFLAILQLGCSQNSQVKNVINAQIPPVQAKIISDMSEIGFEWQSYASYDIDGFYVFRKNGNEFKKISTIKDKYATHYVDTNLAPQTVYYYKIQAYGKDGLSEAKVIEAKTAPRLEAVPFIQAISDLPNRTKLIWRPHPDPIVNSYVIEKKTINSGEFKNIKTIKGRLAAEFIDTDVKAGYNYEYRIFAKTYNGNLSKPSQIVSSQTQSLPKQVQNLKASVNQPKKIVLTWDRLNNFDGYYQIYSSSNEYFPFTKLAQSKTNSYTDLINENGSERLYKVVPVTNDGLEGQMPQNFISGFTLDSPASPIISQANYNNGANYLEWNHQNKINEYIVTRTYNGQKTIFPNITSSSFVDSNVKAGKYEYNIIALDKYGLESLPSNKAVIMVP